MNYLMIFYPFSSISNQRYDQQSSGEKGFFSRSERDKKRCVLRTRTHGRRYDSGLISKHERGEQKKGPAGLCLFRLVGQKHDRNNRNRNKATKSTHAQFHNHTREQRRRRRRNKRTTTRTNNNTKTPKTKQNQE